jgi:hypothetical protein
MWPFLDLTLHSVYMLAGIVTVLGVYHFAVGAGTHMFLVMISIFALISSTTQTNVVLLFDTFPVLGSSLYIPTMFALMSLCAFEIRYRKARLVMLTVLGMLSGTVLMTIYEATYTVLPPSEDFFSYVVQMQRVTELFITMVLVYAFMNSRLTLTNAGQLTSLTGRYVVVLTGVILATFIQMAAFHITYLTEHPEALFYTLASRLFILTLLGIVAALVSERRQQEDCSSQASEDA